MPSAPSPSLRLSGGEIGRRRENVVVFFLIWLRLCQREGDAQGGWCCRQGSSWHRGDRRLLAASRLRKSQSGPGTSTGIPAVMGQPWGSPTAPTGEGWWEMGRVLAVSPQAGGSKHSLRAPATPPSQKQSLWTGKGKSEQEHGRSPFPVCAHSVTGLLTTSGSRRP